MSNHELLIPTPANSKYFKGFVSMTIKSSVVKNRTELCGKDHQTQLLTSFYFVTSITVPHFSLILIQTSAGHIKQLHIDENHVLLQTIMLKI
jgi:hypothetical protein